MPWINLEYCLVLITYLQEDMVNSYKFNRIIIVGKKTLGRFN